MYGTRSSQAGGESNSVASRPGTGPHVPAVLVWTRRRTLLADTGFDHVASSFDVHPLDHLRICVVAVERSDVHDRVAALDGPFEPGRIEQLDPLGANRRSLVSELPGDVRPDEARRARDVDLHRSAARYRPSAIIGQTIR